MITMITGMPGDGKTLYAVMQIIKILAETEYFVVTNIRMRLPEVHALVSKLREARGAKEPWDLDERIKVITDQEAFEFFRYRSGDLILDSSPDVKARDDDGTRRLPKHKHDEAMLEIFAPMKRKPQYRVPVRYFIDECHEIFPSRDWANGGRGILYYTSKHRHLHDEIFLITQQIAQVEKQLRDLTSETFVVRNHTRRNVGAVKLRPVFKLKGYYGLPSPTSKPFMQPEVELGKNWGKDMDGPETCYRTTGALGIHDSPEKVVNKGFLPWWTLWVGAGAIVLLIAFGLTGFPYLMGTFVSKKAADVGQPKFVERAMPKAASVDAVVPPGTQRQQASVAEPIGTHKQDVPLRPVRVTGVISKRDPDRITVKFDDGTEVDERSAVRIELLRNAVKVGETVYRFVPMSAGTTPTSKFKEVEKPGNPSGTIPFNANSDKL